MYSTHNEWKCSQLKISRTLKSKIYKYTASVSKKIRWYSKWIGEYISKQTRKMKPLDVK